MSLFLYARTILLDFSLATMKYVKMYDAVPNKHFDSIKILPYHEAGTIKVCDKNSTK